MFYEQFIMIGRETLMSTIWLVGPVLGASLVAGLVIGIFQAATSINEATLAFVPKLLVVFAVLALAAPFMMTTMTGFFQLIFGEIGRVTR
jgi:flagellar biosynthetic protein FliQ